MQNLGDALGTFTMLNGFPESSHRKNRLTGSGMLNYWQFCFFHNASMLLNIYRNMCLNKNILKIHPKGMTTSKNYHGCMALIWKPCSPTAFERTECLENSNDLNCQGWSWLFFRNTNMWIVDGQHLKAVDLYIKKGKRCTRYTLMGFKIDK